MTKIPSELLSRAFLWSDPAVFECLCRQYRDVANDNWNIEQYVLRLMHTSNCLEVDIIAKTPWLYTSIKRFQTCLTSFADRLTFLEFEYLSVALAKVLYRKNVGANLRTLWSSTEAAFGESRSNQLMLRSYTTVQTLRRLHSDLTKSRLAGTLVRDYCSSRLVDFNRVPEKVPLRTIHPNTIVVAIDKGHGDLVVHILQSVTLNWIPKYWETLIEKLLTLNWTPDNTLLANQALQAIQNRCQNDHSRSAVQNYLKITKTVGLNLPPSIRQNLDAFEIVAGLDGDDEATRARLRYALRHNITTGSGGIQAVISTARTKKSMFLVANDLHAAWDVAYRWNADNTLSWMMYVEALQSRGVDPNCVLVRFLMNRVVLRDNNNNSFRLLHRLLDICTAKRIDFPDHNIFTSLLRLYNDRGTVNRESVESALEAFCRNRFSMKGPTHYVALFKNHCTLATRLSLAIRWLPDFAYAGVVALALGI